GLRYCSSRDGESVSMASHPRRAEIEARLRAGEFESFNQIAREFGASAQTVSRYAAALGIDPLEHSQTKTAIATRKTYDAARRVEVIERAIQMVSELIDSQDTSQKVSPQVLAIALATLIDKRRQEDGLATGTLDVKHRGHVTHGHVDLSRFNDDE